MAPFPVIKLLSLFIKQSSKPVAEYIKRKSKENHFIRTYICMPPAQLYHRYDVWLRLWISGSKKRIKKPIRPLEEKDAINEGANLLGEMFIISVTIGLIGMEYHRQSVNAMLKDEQQETSLYRLTKDLNILKAKLDEQCHDLDELVRLLEVMEDKRINHDTSPPLPRLPKR